MTVTSTISKITYAADGSARTWSFPFKVLDASELWIFRTDRLDVVVPVTADFAVQGIGEAAGGEVTYPVSGPAVPSGEKVTLCRVVNRVQDLDLQNQGGFFPDVVETQLDRMVMMIQEVEEKAERAIKVTISSDLDPDGLVSELYEKAASAEASAVGALASRQGAEDARDEAVAAAESMQPGQFALAAHDHAGSYEPADTDLLKCSAAQTLTVGFDQIVYALGEISGSLTPDVRLGAMQEGTIAGDLTINAPAREGVMELRLVNAATAYTVTTSAFTTISGEYTAGGGKIHLLRLTRYGAGKCILEIAEEIAA